MALSFTPSSHEDGGLAGTRDTDGLPVLVTGAGGRIGSYFAERSHMRYRLRLMAHTPEEHQALGNYGEVVDADLGDTESLERACADIDTVVHLAGDPSPNATWESLHADNVVGTYNLLVAAKGAGCRRVIYASSIHAVSGYAADVQVKTSDPVNPGDLYGVSKCFGEALGRYMAEKQGLSVIALRIGAFQPREAAQSEGSLWMLDAFASRRDLAQLIDRCIAADNLLFAIFHGISNDRYKRLDITDARELVGYDPQDDLAREHPQLKALRFGEEARAHSESDPNQKPGIREELNR